MNLALYTLEKNIKNTYILVTVVERVSWVTLREVWVRMTYCTSVRVTNWNSDLKSVTVSVVGAPVVTTVLSIKFRSTGVGTTYEVGCN